MEARKAVAENVPNAFTNERRLYAAMCVVSLNDKISKKAYPPARRRPLVSFTRMPASITAPPSPQPHIRPHRASHPAAPSPII